MILLLASAAKVAIVVLVGLAVASLVRNRAAAVRHWVLLVVVGCALATPLVAQVVPSWRVPFGGGWLATTERTAESVTGVKTAPVETGNVARRATLTRTQGQASSVPPFTVGQVITPVWLAGVGLSLSLLLVGLARLARLSSTCHQIADGRAAELLHDVSERFGLRRPVTLLESNYPGVVMTWGLVRPKVILPTGAQSWTDDRIRAVLSHEVAHIHRGDWGAQLLGELLRSLHWFNPLVWIVCRRLRQESECACDDAVLGRGIEGPEYAAHVLALARSFRSQGRLWWPAHGIARQSGLERRFVAMLNTRLDRRPVTGLARLATVAALVSIMLPIAAFSTAQTFSTFSGYVFDSTNRILPGATLALTSLQREAKHEVRSNGSGHFEFVGLPPGDYLLESLTPGFDVPLGQVTMIGEDVQRNLTLQVGSLVETITVTGEDPPAGVVDRRDDKREADECNYSLSVGGNIRPPRKVRSVAPTYPAHLRGAKVAGVVVLDGRIGTTGFMDEVRVVSTPHPDFAAAAVEAVQQWEYDWTLLNCVPVEVPMMVTVRFESQP